VLHLITAFLAAIHVFFRSRVDTSLDVLALRQQVAVLKRKRPRPSLNLRSFNGPNQIPEGGPHADPVKVDSKHYTVC